MTEGLAIASAPPRTPPALAGRTAVVLGYGKSGRAAAVLLAREGAAVRVSDASPLEKLGIEPAAIPGGARWIGGEDAAILSGADLLVVSPGVPPRNPIMRAALALGLPTTSELELGWRFTKAPVVAITGTNGKTTTVELCGAIARAAGKKAIVAGNVGTPLTAFAGEPADLVVLEVSSFQLAFGDAFRPEVGAILNLTEDHLDWHPNFEDYANAKRAMFERQTSEDAAVLPSFDAELTRRFAGIPGRVHHFGETPFDGFGAFLRGGDVIVRTAAGEERVMALTDWALPGRHNRENLLAATLSMRLAGISADAIGDACRAFRGLPHRMEVVASEGGVTWVNDSKSTNPGSLEKALDSAVPTLLIAGGVTKGCDFRSLEALVAEATRVVYVIGDGASEMEAAWGKTSRVVRAGTLEEAVRLAKAEARKGERVLLSPGCASFDQFRNYAHRGDRFRELVRETGIHREGEGS